MKKLWFTLALAAALVLPVSPAGATDDLAKKMSDLLVTAPAAGHWQVKAADVSKMIAEKKTDFLVVDVRPEKPGQAPGKIAGSIYIPYNQVLTAESLAKLPKDKKLILICVTGQTQNLPVLALRALGYDAWTMSFGMTSWIKGYLGAKIVQDAIAGADYPVEAVGAAPAAAPAPPAAPAPAKAPPTGGYGN
jgi:rhodanese-related sulfurtransferase